MLPSLGEDRVQTCTLRDLVAEAADAIEIDAAVARVKADGRLVDAVTAAVRLYEQPPERATLVETPWTDLRVRALDWEEAFDADTDAPHNEARDDVWESLVSIVLDRFGEQIPGRSCAVFSRRTRHSPRRSAVPGLCLTHWASSPRCGPAPVS